MGFREISYWLREHSPKTGSGHDLPKGVRARGKIKPEQIKHQGTARTESPTVFTDKNGKVIPKGNGKKKR